MAEKREIWEDPAIVAWVDCLLDSYERLVGRSLLPHRGTARERSEQLYNVPFVVVSHGTEANPILNYGNRAALDLWGLTWEEWTQTPSRDTVRGDDLGSEERQKMLDRVREQGYISDYKGIRISKTDRRFWIERGTVWNVIDRSGVYRGQAATFAHWTFLG